MAYAGGPAPILLLSALIAHSDELALYEHGTFRPRLTADVCERLLKNPRNFAVKSFAASEGPRAEFVKCAAERLGVQSPTSKRGNSVVAVVARLVASINMLPEFAKRTQAVSEAAQRVRGAILLATEPDVLLFDLIPQALGSEPISADTRVTTSASTALAESLAGAIAELSGAYPDLLKCVRRALVHSLKPDHEEVQGSLARRALELRDKVLDGRVRALATALHAELPDEESWLPYVAMQVTGTPPEGWTDDDRRRFESAIADLGSSMLRIEALNADVRAAGGEFTALRIAVNSTAGDDLVRLIQVDANRRAEADSVLDEVLSRLRATGQGEGTEWLLARLLERELNSATPRDVGDIAYAQEVKRNEESA